MGLRVNNQLPVIFNSVWPTNADRRMSYDGPQLRNEDDFYRQISRLASMDRHPLICFPRAWNDFPSAEIKSIPDKLTFKFNKALKKHFLSELSADYLCSRLLCPHCHLLSPLGLFLLPVIFAAFWLLVLWLVGMVPIPPIVVAPPFVGLSSSHNL